MNTSLHHHEFKLTLYTVSTSLLLCTSMEVQASSADDETTPWYRQDVPTFAFPAPEVPQSGHFIRQPGLENQLLTIEQAAPSAWQRVYGGPARQAEQDVLNSQFSSIASHPAVNSPAFLTVHGNGGNTQRMGLVGGAQQIQSNGNGTLIGPALADPNTDSLNLAGESLGAYWSLTGASGWHVDLTASGGRVSGYSRNSQGERQATEGRAVTLSVEGGFPIGISKNWVIEPQAQLINQRISLEASNAGSDAPSSDLNSWSGRVGARLKGSYDINGLPVEPYVRTNLWHTVNTSATVTLDQVDKISSSRNSSTVELGLGLVARVTPTVSLYVSADYSSDVDDNDLNGLIGSLGVRMRW
ncbi:autotransporter outer membrane beta-barrel domain-containing protein [Pseudomonas sp. FW300-N1A1]|uniref:autotransporter domain-containing protein n=1 Tax=Pseudomonas sp. FW300-N1A1 TaxID=2075555 RepID=UPI000CD0ABD4|nr:autotransporter outer membrane beta-barrel domain-containing protein [Pseudomonas sp. FW300-N1A1]POA21917.1 autotransporter outer membrane beta-barrel domain-containing protein [Pseudomonas sp. FW300-N1A1]